METWILLIFLAQLTWAIGFFVDAYLLRKLETSTENGVEYLVMMSCMFKPVIILGLVLLSIILPLLGTGPVDLYNISTTNKLIAMGIGVVEMLYLIPYLSAVDESDEFQTAPLFQLEPVWGFFFGLLVFKEIPAVQPLVGGAIIVAGAVLLNIEKAVEHSGGFRVKWTVVKKMLMASGLVAFIAFVFKETSLEENYWATSFWMCLGTFISGILLWIFRPKYRREFNNFIRERNYSVAGVNLLNEIADNLAILLFYGAVVLGPSTVLVQAMKGYQPLLVLIIGFALVLLGSKVHKEKAGDTTRVALKVAGIITIVGGSLLIF